MMFINPIIALIHNAKAGTYHPVLFVENPLPGNPDISLVRYKSKMHHTAGFSTIDEAKKYAEEDLGPKVECKNFSFDSVFEWDGEGIPAMVAFTMPKDSGKLVAV